MSIARNAMTQDKRLWSPVCNERSPCAGDVPVFLLPTSPALYKNYPRGKFYPLLRFGSAGDNDFTNLETHQLFEEMVLDSLKA